MASPLLATSVIHRIFEEETLSHGGKVKDAFDDGCRLFLRSILPSTREVRPKDRVKPGVALRATEEDVWIHPYLFRQVCTNGAIMAHAIQTEHLRIATLPDGEEAEWAIRAAIHACSTHEVFATSAAEMRSTIDRGVDFAITLMATLGRMGQHADGQVFADIVQRFFEGGDQSAFGWMNAMTSVARDTEDPDLRWRLEEAGGGVPALLDDTPRRPRFDAEPLVFEDELVCVA